MDWKTIIFSVLGSSAVTGILIFIFKKSFEKFLDIQYSILIDKNEAFILEMFRRKANLFDKQADALQVSVSLVYRLRNTLRDLIDIEVDNDDEVVKSIERAINYHNALSDLLFEKRAVLPKHVFVKLHEIKSIFTELKSCTHFIKRSRDICSGEPIELNDKKEYILESYRKLDEAYTVLVDTVHQALEIESQ